MVMKRIMETFNNFLDERDTVDFRFEAILVSRFSTDRGKNEVLSDIRSFPGVTVVAVREADKPRPGEDYSLLSLKVDRLLLGQASVATIIKNLTNRVNRLEGVKSFTVKGIPEEI